ncbi:hypothetical protein Tco_0190908 [Tanacetum coccineum]
MHSLVLPAPDSRLEKLQSSLEYGYYYPRKQLLQVSMNSAELTRSTRLSIIKRSRQETHSSHASGSGADEGTGVTPGVPDAPDYDSDDDISWKSSDDESEMSKIKMIVVCILWIRNPHAEHQIKITGVDDIFTDNKLEASSLIANKVQLSWSHPSLALQHRILSYTTTTTTIGTPALLQLLAEKIFQTCLIVWLLMID